MTTSPDESLPPEELIWSCVEDGFYVASVSGHFLGYVDTIDAEKFQVCNALSQQIGLYSSLDAAMAHVAAQSRASHDGQADGSER